MINFAALIEQFKFTILGVSTVYVQDININQNNSHFGNINLHKIHSLAKIKHYADNYYWFLPNLKECKYKCFLYSHCTKNAK